ncbi:MAG: hypothetical protein D6818_09175 [Bacteroidetes bacterium]|nr:MAG: hypothetical protein D6818_09175 [Bacteroidota bacterium]
MAFGTRAIQVENHQKTPCLRPERCQQTGRVGITAVIPVGMANDFERELVSDPCAREAGKQCLK